MTDREKRASSIERAGKALLCAVPYRIVGGKQRIVAGDAGADYGEEKKSMGIFWDSFFSAVGRAVPVKCIGDEIPMHL